MNQLAVRVIHPIGTMATIKSRMAETIDKVFNSIVEHNFDQQPNPFAERFRTEPVPHRQRSMPIPVPRPSAHGVTWNHPREKFVPFVPAELLLRRYR
jgi:hypothetical protein